MGGGGILWSGPSETHDGIPEEGKIQPAPNNNGASAVRGTQGFLRKRLEKMADSTSREGAAKSQPEV